MEDELILADLGVVERRLERIEKDLKKARTAELEKERDLVQRCKAALEDGQAAARARADGRRSQAAARISVALGEAAPPRHQPRRGRSRRRRLERRARGAENRPHRHSSRTPRPAPSPLCTKIELEIAQLEGADADGVPRRSRPDRVGPRSRDPRHLRPARLHVVLHRRRGRMPRVVDGARHARAARGRRDPQRHPARLHPRRSRRLRRAHDPRLDGRPASEHGEVRLEGKEYIVQDGDIINFRHAT